MHSANDLILRYVPEVEGRDNVVGIATCYGLDVPGIEFRWRARFSAPVQNVPGAHPTAYTMDTGSLSQG
jgi:hypothetical protein